MFQDYYDLLFKEDKNNMTFKELKKLTIKNFLKYFINKLKYLFTFSSFEELTIMENEFIKKIRRKKL